MQESQQSVALSVGETGIGPIGVDHDDSVIDQTRGGRQESQFVGTVRTRLDSNFTQESAGGPVAANGEVQGW